METEGAAPLDPPLEPLLPPKSEPIFEYPEKFYTIALPWLAQKMVDKSHLTKWRDPKTGEEWDFRLWIIWMARRGFVYFWPRYEFPTGCMVARQISLEMVKNWKEIPEDQLPYVYDLDGDGAWVDFLWAPGQKGEAISRLQRKGITWVGWQHRKTFEPHIHLIKDLLQNKAFDRADKVVRLI